MLSSGVLKYYAKTSPVAQTDGPYIFAGFWQCVHDVLIAVTTSSGILWRMDFSFSDMVGGLCPILRNSVHQHYVSPPWFHHRACVCANKAVLGESPWLQ